MKNQYRGGLPKKGGGLEKFSDLGGGAWLERGGVFEGQGVIPQFTLWSFQRIDLESESVPMQESVWNLHSRNL